MRVIIAVTGGGGHLYCGLSIARALTRLNASVRIFFVGSVPCGIPGSRFYRARAAGWVKGKGIKFFLSQIMSFAQSFFLYTRIRPEVTVSTGGFVSAGISVWSWIFRVPLIIHEQNIVPGKANLFLKRFARRVMISFRDTKPYFGKKAVFTGMPVRYEKRLSKQDSRSRLGLDPGRFTILIMGGSKGSRRINSIVAGSLDRFPKEEPGIQFIHLTGEEDLGFVENAYREKRIPAYVRSFDPDMDVVYSASDFVLSRAGSGTIAELAFFGLPCILVPYPYSMDMHQHKNAEFVAEKGAALVLTEEYLTADRLLEVINDKEALAKMAERIRGLSNPDADSKIAENIMEVLNA